MRRVPSATDIMNLNIPNQYPVVSREENQSMHSYIAGIVSTGIIASISAGAYHELKSRRSYISNIANNYWSQIKSLDNYQHVEDFLYKYMGGRRKPAVVANPIYTFSINTPYSEEYHKNTEIINTRLSQDIRHIERSINSHNDISKMYIDRVRGMLNIDINADTNDINEVVSKDPMLARRYRDELEDSLKVITSIEQDVASNNISDPERMMRHTQASMSIGRKGASQMILMPEGVNPFQPRVVQESVDNPVRLFRTLRQNPNINWSDNRLFREEGYSDVIKISKLEPKLLRLYNKLRKSIINKCGTQGAIGNISTQIISYGGDHRGIRFLINLKYTFGNTPIGTAPTREVTKSIDIPLGNIEGKIHIGNSLHGYVGRLVDKQKKWYTPAVDYVDALIESTDDLAVGLYDTLMTNTDSKFNIAVNKANAKISQRIVASRGEISDKGVRTMLDDNLNKYYPGRLPSSEELRELKKEWKQVFTTYKQSIHSTMSNKELDVLKDRLEELDYMMGKGGDIASRLNKFTSQMIGEIDKYPGMAKIFWETAATHSGMFRFISVFGDSPYKFSRNPQRQSYQFWNVYDLKENMRDYYPLRWGGRAPLPEEAYKNARMLYVFGDIYPYNSDEVITTREFRDKMDKSTKAYEPREIRIPRSGLGGPVDIRDSYPELQNLLKQINSSSTTDVINSANMPNNFNVREHLANNPILLKANRKLATGPDGLSIKTGKWDFHVRDIVVRQDEIVLVGDANINDPRWRSIMVKSTPVVKEFNKIFALNNRDVWGDVDIVTGSSLGRKITPHEIQISALADAVEKTRRDIISLEKLNAQNNSTVNKLDIHIAQSQRNKTTAREMEINNLKTKLRNTARILGARYNEQMYSIEFTPVMGSDDYREFLKKASPVNIDKAMIELGEVYTADEHMRIRKLWQAERDTGMLGGKLISDDVKEWMDRITDSGARYLRLVEGLDSRTMIGVKVLDQVAAMKQSADDFYRVFKFKPQSDVGIGIKYSELQFLYLKYANVPESVRKLTDNALDKYIAGITEQMGGKEFAKEYHKVLGIETIRPGKGDRIIDLTNNDDDFTKAFKDAVRKTNIRNAEERIYIDPTDNRTLTMEEAIEVRNKGIDVLEVPVYKTKESDLGIFDTTPRAYDPTKKFMGSYLKLKKPTKMFIGGRWIESEYLYIPDIMKMKSRMFGGYDPAMYDVKKNPSSNFMMIPKVWGHIERVTKLAEKGLDPGEEYGMFYEDINREYYEGSQSALRTRTYTAHMPGVQGIMMSGRSLVLGKQRKDISHITTLKEFGTNVTLQSGVLNPYDIAISTQTFDDIKDDIARVLEEHHTKVLSQELPQLSSDEIESRLKLLVDNDLHEIKLGRKPVPVAITRHPVTGIQGRHPTRMHVLNELNKKGFSRRHMVGEALQRMLWMDNDFDLGQVSLATHIGEWEAMQTLYETQFVEGSAEWKMTQDYTDEIRIKGKDKVIKVPKFYQVRDNKIYTYAVEEKSGIKKFLPNYASPLLDSMNKPAEIDVAPFLDYLSDCIDKGKEPSGFDINFYRKLDPKTINNTKVIDAMSKYVEQTEMFVPLMAQKAFAGTVTAYSQAINVMAANNVDRINAAHISDALGKMIQDMSLSAKKWDMMDGGTQRQMNKFGMFQSAYKNMRNSNDTYANMLRDERNGFGFTNEQIEAILSIPLEKRKQNVYKAAGITYDLFYKTGDMMSEIPSALRPMYASLLGKDQNYIFKHLIGNLPDVVETDEILYGIMAHARQAAENQAMGTKESIEQELSLEDNKFANQFKIRGRIDAVMNGNVIEEYKTIGAEQFNKLTNHKPIDEHFSQINFYMKANNSTTGRMIYYNRENPNEKKIINVQYNEQRLLDDLMKVSNARKQAEAYMSSVKTFQMKLMEGISFEKPGSFMANAAKFGGLGDLTIPGYVPTEPIKEGYITEGYFKRKRFIGPLLGNKLENTMLSDAVGEGAARATRLGLYGAGVLGGAILTLGFFNKSQFSGMGELPGKGGEFWSPIKGARADVGWGHDLGNPESDIFGKRKVRLEMYNPEFQEKLASIPGRIGNTIMPERDWTVKRLTTPSIVNNKRPDVNSYINNSMIIR